MFLVTMKAKPKGIKLSLQAEKSSSITHFGKTHLRWPNTVFARALQSSLLMRGSARTMITKMKHGADKAKIYLFYAVPACDIIILKMTQCVICFSLLFVWNVRKS